MVTSGMQQTVVPPCKRSKIEDSKLEKSEENKYEGHEMLVGESMDSKQARNEWIDAVEKILEDESLERGQQHLRKNFDNAAIHNESKRYQIQEGLWKPNLF